MSGDSETRDVARRRRKGGRKREEEVHCGMSSEREGGVIEERKEGGGREGRGEVARDLRGHEWTGGGYGGGREPLFRADD